MARSRNCNPNAYRSKYDMSHDLETDYKRIKNKKIIEKELEDLEEKEENTDIGEITNRKELTEEDDLTENYCHHAEKRTVKSSFFCIKLREKLEKINKNIGIIRSTN